MSKKHHYVPRSLLRNFSIAGEGKTVVVFDKKTRKVYESSVADAGAENYFNSVEVCGQEVNLEGAFQQLDSRLATLVGRILTKQTLDHLTAQERWDLSLLAVVQLQRVKLMRTTLMSFPRQLREMLKEHGLEPSDEVLPNIDENEAKVMTLATLDGSDEWIRAIETKHWSLYTTPARYPFWISDSPIVVSNVFPYGDLGLSSPGVQVCWPLSSETLLSFVCPTIAAKVEQRSPMLATKLRANPVIASTPTNVDYYNSLQVSQSARFVYGPGREFPLAHRMLDDHPELGHVETKMPPSQLGRVSRNNRMPPGQWLVVYGARSHYLVPLESWISDKQRPLRVTVKAEGVPELQRAMVDVPHTAISLYEDGYERRMMKEVILTRDPENLLDVTVSHVDPAIERIIQGGT